jgi:quercetin dioxygenase-like cupin family protein
LIVAGGLGGAALGRLDPTGDVVWFAPGEKHWHGAGPATGRTHIAIQEALDGKGVDWMEKAS